jgi:SAM-dependent methyltransferase
MTPFLRGLVRAVAETCTLPGPIVEVGSRLVTGQEDLGDLRPFFPGRAFVGLDVRPGPGVDMQASVEALPLADRSVGTILALNTLEHVPRFWLALQELRRVLRPDGVLLVACPFHVHIHRHPEDYWRFTPEALDLLLEGYPSRVLGWQGPRSRPAAVWALAFGPDRPPLSAGEYAHYLARLNAHGRMPLPWFRRLRYRVARWLCGRGPVAPYLERDRWECVRRGSAA